MRQAISGAEVGDDVLDGDPTTRLLEARVAELLGHEAALFFPSGTQANQTALGLHLRPGDELIVDNQAHIVHLEQGGAAALWGAQVRTVDGVDGVISVDTLEPLIRTGDLMHPHTGLISVENTHNASGGRVTSLAGLEAIRELSSSHGVPLHLDGARLWNAAAAAGVSVKAFGSLADTVMVSFSKGLGCPAGSCLAGSADLMRRGRALRQRLGGGMRQSGILTAACLYAMDHNLGRLSEDHERARLLAHLFRAIPQITVTNPDTNIVMIDLKLETATEAETRLRRAGVLLSVFGPRRLRAVTHLQLDDGDVREAGERVARVLSREAA
jgi:threonine aldolase